MKTNTKLDILFGGGIKHGQLVEIFGEFASSKTQIMFTLLTESKGNVVYIDSEGTFSPERIRDIALARGKDPAEISKRILYFQPTDWKQQIAIPHQLKDEAEISLIIVDSLMAHFRDKEDFIGRENLNSRQGIIRCHLAKLRILARKYKCIVVFTNQVYDKPNVANPYTPLYSIQIGVGGHSVYHIPDIRIFVRKVGGSPKRVARLMDSSELPNMEVAYMVGEKGIQDIEDETEEEEELEVKPKKVNLIEKED